MNHDTDTPPSAPPATPYKYYPTETCENPAVSHQPKLASSGYQAPPGAPVAAAQPVPFVQPVTSSVANAPVAAAAMPVAMPTVAAVGVVAQPQVQQIAVTVPPYGQPGGTIVFRMPNGQQGKVTIPPGAKPGTCLLYTSPSPRDKRQARMPSSA